MKCVMQVHSIIIQIDLCIRDFRHGIQSRAQGCSVLYLTRTGPHTDSLDSLYCTCIKKSGVFSLALSLSAKWRHQNCHQSVSAWDHTIQVSVNSPLRQTAVVYLQGDWHLYSRLVYPSRVLSPDSQRDWHLYSGLVYYSRVRSPEVLIRCLYI